MRLLVINTISDPSTERVRRRHPGKVQQRPVVAGRALPAPNGRRTIPTDLLTPEVVDHLEYLSSIGNVRVVEMGSTRRELDFAAVRAALGFPTVPEKAVDLVELSPPADVLSLETEMRANTDQMLRALGVPEDFVSGDVPSESVEAMLQHTTAVDRAMAEQFLDSISGTLPTTDEPASTEEPPAPAEPVEEPVEEPAAESTPADPEVVAIEELLAPSEPEPLPEASAEAWVAPADLVDLVRNAKKVPLQQVLTLLGGTGTGKTKMEIIGEVMDALLPEAGEAGPDPVQAQRALVILRGQ